MRRRLWIGLYLLVIFLCFLFQGTVFEKLNFGGISPNLMIIVVASVGFMKGEKDGLIAGFVCGLMTDIYYGDIIGLYALIYMYIGFLNGKFTSVFFPEDLKLPLSLIFVSDLSYGLTCYVLQFLLRGRFNFTYIFLHIILPEVVYTIVIGIMIYPLLLMIYKKILAEEKRSETDFD